jgi:hypothetical protein
MNIKFEFYQKITGSQERSVWTLAYWHIVRRAWGVRRVTAAYLHYNPKEYVNRRQSMGDENPRFEIIEDEPPKPKRKRYRRPLFGSIPWPWVVGAFIAGVALVSSGVLLLSIPGRAEVVSGVVTSTAPIPTATYVQYLGATPPTTPTPAYAFEPVVDMDEAGHLQAVAGQSTLRLYEDGAFIRLLDTYEAPRKSEFHADVAFSPNGQQIAFLTVGPPGDSKSPPNATLKLWNNGSFTGMIMAHEGGMAYGYFGVALAYSPDGKLLATGAGDGRTMLWDTATMQQLGQLETGATGTMSMVFSQDGKQLTMITRHGTTFSADVTGQIQVWDVSDPASPRRVSDKAFPTNWLVVRWAALSGDGRYAAFFNADNEVELRDVYEDRLTGKFTLPASDATVEDIALSPSGDIIAFTQFQNIWQGGDQYTLQTTVRALRLHLVDGTVSTYDELSTPTQIGQGGAFGGYGAYNLRFAHDGNTLAYFTVDTNTLVEWNLNTGETRTSGF